jgi:carboxypeptidase C (cathepsin A)
VFDSNHPLNPRHRRFFRGCSVYRILCVTYDLFPSVAVKSLHTGLIYIPHLTSLKRELKVVIASPNDVTKEREALNEVIQEVNDDTDEDLDLILKAVRWETDTYPGFHVDGPQGLVDSILKIEDCDILIGIFWKRFGTHTPDGRTGTEHEFHRAYEAWQKNKKPHIMMYFSRQKYSPETLEESKQQTAVLEFKRDFPKEGLYWEYRTLKEFRQDVFKHLKNYLRNNFKKKPDNEVQSLKNKYSDNPHVKDSISDQSVASLVRVVEPDSPGLSVLDTTQYGSGRDDSISDATEKAVVTQHSITISGATISYTAHAGHLVTDDQYSGRPSAKIFYVSFTANEVAASSRPVTFFHNGGPGSSSMFLLLGSFGPRRVKTRTPYFTPPPPYVLEDNADSLLDRTDLVFINPVGTGYSAAIAPGKNEDFWGVDEDARSFKQFIKRYLTVYGRWNSPKFLFGESYGTPGTCVLAWLLHEDGVDLNGIVLQSSILDYSKPNGSVGILPTFAADAWHHKKVTVSPAPTDLASFVKQVEEFARGPYVAAMANYPKADPATVRFLTQILGIHPEVLRNWKLDPDIGNGTIYLTSLLQDDGLAVGAYDGRITANDTGIDGSVDPNSGGNDPTITAVGGVYSTMWNVYVNEEIKYTSTSLFNGLNDQAFKYWNFNHVDPTGAQKGGQATLYTAGDLAASVELNPYLKVFCAGGYYDAVTPFFQTVLDLENMPLGNLVFHTYPSGHMVYLDNGSRSKMKADLGAFYDRLASRPEGRISQSP